jgi:hypothetical protein
VPLVEGTPRQKERPCPATGVISSMQPIILRQIASVECATDDLAQARADELLADTETLDGTRFVCEAKQHSGRLILN